MKQNLFLMVRQNIVFDLSKGLFPLCDFHEIEQGLLAARTAHNFFAAGKIFVYSVKYIIYSQGAFPPHQYLQFTRLSGGCLVVIVGYRGTGQAGTGPDGAIFTALAEVYRP
jgi:hypothetical protein